MNNALRNILQPKKCSEKARVIIIKTYGTIIPPLSGYSFSIDPREATTPFFCNLSFTLFNNLLAQTNSVARIHRPNGITIKAGPGSTINAIPIRRIVIPITPIISLFTFFKTSDAFMGVGKADEFLALYLFS